MNYSLVYCKLQIIDYSIIGYVPVKFLMTDIWSRAWTSNYIPQILWDVITCPCPSGTQVIIWHRHVLTGLLLFKEWDLTIKPVSCFTKNVCSIHKRLLYIWDRMGPVFLIRQFWLHTKVLFTNYSLGSKVKLYLAIGNISEHEWSVK